MCLKKRTVIARGQRSKLMNEVSQKYKKGILRVFDGQAHKLQGYTHN